MNSPRGIFRMRRGSLLLAVIGLAVAIAAESYFVLRASVSNLKVTERWTTYIENLEPSQKLVILTADKRYAASKEFSAKLLSIAKINASIDLSAWAEVSYFVDLSDASLWSVDWDRKAKVLTLSAPDPDCLLPAVKTETIDIQPKGANLVTNAVFRLKAEAEKMRSELSADFHKAARADMADEAVQKGMRAGLEGFARGFCASVLRVTPSAVVVRFKGEK